MDEVQQVEVSLQLLRIQKHRMEPGLVREVEVLVRVGLSSVQLTAEEEQWLSRQSAEPETTDISKSCVYALFLTSALPLLRGLPRFPVTNIAAPLEGPSRM